MTVSSISKIFAKMQQAAKNEARKNVYNVLQILPVRIPRLNKDKHFIEAWLDGFGKPFCHPNSQRVSK